MIRICENWLRSLSVDTDVFVDTTPKVREVKELAQDIERGKTKVRGYLYKS